MRTNPLKFRCPFPLYSRLKARAKELGYRSVTAYILGLIRYDFLTRKPHSATIGIECLTRPQQDKADDEIARMFDSGETLNGSYFERIMMEAVKASGAAVPDQKRLVQELLSRISK